MLSTAIPLWLLQWRVNVTLGMTMIWGRKCPGWTRRGSRKPLLDRWEVRRKWRAWSCRGCAHWATGVLAVLLREEMLGPQPLRVQQLECRSSGIDPWGGFGSGSKADTSSCPAEGASEYSEDTVRGPLFQSHQLRARQDYFNLVEMLQTEERKWSLSSKFIHSWTHHLYPWWQEAWGNEKINYTK